LGIHLRTFILSIDAKYKAFKVKGVWWSKGLAQEAIAPYRPFFGQAASDGLAKNLMGGFR
jgi:hypothetical protein